MTTQEILASLSQLEKELESIASARLLAEKTVNAYQEVQGDIKVFFSEFQKVMDSLNTVSNAFESEKSALTTDVKTTVDILKGQLDTLNKAFANQCNAIVLGFVNSSNEAADGFKTKIDSLTADFELNNDTLKSRITELSSVQGTISKAVESVSTIKSDIATLQGQLTDSQKQQDATLESIAHELKSAGARNGEILSKLSEELKKSQDAQDEDLANLMKVQKSQSDKIDEVLKGEEKLVFGIELVISTLNEQIAKVDNALNTIKQNVNGVSTKLDTIQVKQDSIASAVENAKTGISGLGTLIDNKTKETNGKCEEILNVGKSAKSMIIVNIVICIIALLVALLLPTRCMVPATP